MGKASKWFKAFLRKKWNDVKSCKNKDIQQHHHCDHNLDDKSHYYYGVSSTSSVHRKNNAGIMDLQYSGMTKTSSVRTEARTTSNGEERAAIVIQSHFRAYLSRRALRALKGLVKLQALVRGHIVRKQTADMLRRMQALIRAQSRARAERAQGPARNGSIDDEKILEIYTNELDKQRNLFHSSDLSLNSYQFSFSLDEMCYSSADNSTQLHSTASSRCPRSRSGPFTPTKSMRSFTSDQYSSNHPNYMSYTEAAKAKTRSMSAPKLRPHQYDMSSSTKRYSRSNMQKGSGF